MLMTECSAYVQIDIAKIKSTSNTIKDISLIIRIWLCFTLSYRGSIWKQRIFAIQRDVKVQSTKYATSDRKILLRTPHVLELHFQDDQNEIRHPTQILFWDTTILFVETPGVERAAEEREENWIKSNRQAISQKRKKQPRLQTNWGCTVQC